MKRFIYTFLAGVSFLGMSSCDKDFDQVNKNPNDPTQPLSYGLFNSANKEIMDYTRNQFQSGRLTLNWMQYAAQTNYTEEDRFQYRETSGNSLWFRLYAVAQDYKTIIDLNTNEDTKNQTSAYGTNNNQIAAARIMLAYVFAQLTESFGDVPYYSYGNKDTDFQALNPDLTLMPKYVSQEKIFTDILKELKEAAAEIDMNERYVFSKGDQIFGTPAKMKRFANSLRLRIANRVKHVIPSAQTHITEAIADGVMQSNDDSVGLTYEDNSTYPSPMYAAYFVDNRTDFAAANTFVELLKGVSGNFGQDPRLQKYFAPVSASIANVRDNNYTESTNADDYVGMPYGITSAMASSQYNGGSAVSFFSSNVLKKNYTEMFMEYSEVCFLLSEVNNWDNDWYKKGVQASMEKWGVKDTDIAAFVNTLPAASQENVLTQKYIALYMQPHEAWSEYRRTGYPNTLLKVNASHDLNLPYSYKDGSGNTVSTTTYTFVPQVTYLTDIPARLMYSITYKKLNEANYLSALSNMGFQDDTMDGKMIWAKK